MALAQLLAGKRGTEVGVAIADDPERALCGSRSQLMVARVTALGGDQARGALSLVLEQQPLELTSAKPQPLRRQPDRQHSVDHGLDRLDPVDLAHAHRDRRRRSCHRRTSAPGARAADSATSLLGQNATLLIGSYKADFLNTRYVHSAERRGGAGDCFGDEQPFTSGNYPRGNCAAQQGWANGEGSRLATHARSLLRQHDAYSLSFQAQWEVGGSNLVQGPALARRQHIGSSRSRQQPGAARIPVWLGLLMCNHGFYAKTARELVKVAGIQTKLASCSGPVAFVRCQSLLDRATLARCDDVLQ